MNKDQVKGRHEETKGKGRDDHESNAKIQKSAGKDHIASDDRKEERKDARKGK